jgi:hypothetical protein
MNLAGMFWFKNSNITLLFQQVGRNVRHCPSFGTSFMATERAFGESQRLIPPALFAARNTNRLLTERGS